MKITFSINRYDKDGDICDSGIFLHIDNTTILKIENMQELDRMIENLQQISTEIKENH